MPGHIKAWVTTNRSPPNYWPGEIISGKLFVQTLDSTQTIAQLRLRLYGAGKVVLERFELIPFVAQRRMKYHQTEVYVENCKAVQNLTVVPHPDTISSGIHVFEFNMMLPREAPPTFRGVYGNIEYNLSILSGNARMKPVLFSLPIGVLAALDITQVQQAQGPVYREVEFINGGCFSGTRHDIQAKVWLQRGSCMQGEKLPLRLEINNNSDIKIKYIQLKLRRSHVYQSMGEIETVETYVPNFCTLTSWILPKTRVAWDADDLRLILPLDLVVSGPPGCSIIHLSYELVVKIVPEGCASTVTLRLPVVVGARMPDSVRAQVDRNESNRRAASAAVLLAMTG